MNNLIIFPLVPAHRLLCSLSLSPFFFLLQQRIKYTNLRYKWNEMIAFFKHSLLRISLKMFNQLNEMAAMQHARVFGTYSILLYNFLIV